MTSLARQLRRIGSTASLFSCLWSGSIACKNGTEATDSQATESSGDIDFKYQATIRRTSFGIPHILADDWGSLGFGQGYAFAQDHACILADQIIKVRSERARYFGPGEQNRHINSDFGYLSLGLRQRAQTVFSQQSEQIQEFVRGYASGYNLYLEEVGPDAVPGYCQGAEWLVPISELDLMAYYIQLGLLAGGAQVVEYIGAAQPPSASSGKEPQPGWDRLGRRSMGSNGWAIGRERSENGRGMILANPHFPWEGELKLWESHLTIPGSLNVYGASLMGVPGVLIGFNEHVAWTHTFASSGQRATGYTLDLVPGKPTFYVYDGEEREMTNQQFTIQVKQEDGSLVPKTRTLYFSHYGPIVSIQGSWTQSLTLTFRDANIDNSGLLEQFFAMNRAQSLDEFKAAFTNIGGIPWVHTLATNTEGEVWYADASATPNLRPEAVEAWQLSLNQGGFAKLIYDQAGIVVLNGSVSLNEWVNEPAAIRPGVIPFTQAPQLMRSDFVMNSNNSHWLAQPKQPLEGFSRLYGSERTPQSPRTRMNLTLLTESGEGKASGIDGKFSLAELQEAVFSNRSMTAELLLDEVIARCSQDNAPPQVVAPCTILSQWDGRYDLDRVGPLLWREFLATFDASDTEDQGALFATTFHPEDPIATPHTLAPYNGNGNDPIVLALLEAAAVLQNSTTLGMKTTLGDLQYALRDGQKIPIHGSYLEREGVANAMGYDSLQNTSLGERTPRGQLLSYGGLSTYGYVINYGSSFVMAMRFTEQGPEAQALLTYSQSDDVSSPYFSDQTLLFSQKKWRPVLFQEEQIVQDSEFAQQVVTLGTIKDE